MEYLLFPHHLRLQDLSKAAQQGKSGSEPLHPNHGRGGYCRVSGRWHCVNGQRETATFGNLYNYRTGYVAVLLNSGGSKYSPTGKARLTVDSKSHGNGRNRAALWNGYVPVKGHLIGCETLTVCDSAQDKNPRIILMVNITASAWDRCRKNYGRIQCYFLHRISKIFCRHNHTPLYAPQPQPHPLPPQVKMGVMPYTGIEGTGQERSSCTS